jgi:hypothetical protein
MQNYLDKIKPKVGDAWRTDELYLKIRGNTKYLYAIMDDQSLNKWQIPNMPLTLHRCLEKLKQLLVRDQMS